MNKLELNGDWEHTKRRLKQKWSKLTDDDFIFTQGRSDDLLERIQKRTGASRATVEAAIKEASSYRLSPSGSRWAWLGAPEGAPRGRILPAATPLRDELTG